MAPLGSYLQCESTAQSQSPGVYVHKRQARMPSAGCLAVQMLHTLRRAANACDKIFRSGAYADIPGALL